jgi:hypothetical protein
MGIVYEMLVGVLKPGDRVRMLVDEEKGERLP